MRFSQKLMYASALLIPFLAATAWGDGDPAPNFPPGVATDGVHYDLNDLRGKVVALIFFDSRNENNKDKAQEWNKLAEQYKDKPIKFIAVMSRSNLAMAQKYVSDSGLQIPVFADNMNVMDARYGQKLSNNNARAYRIIGPDGTVVGHELETEELDKDLAGVSWKYRGQGYDAKLNPIIDLLESNQYQMAVKKLQPLARNHSASSMAQSAVKLYAAVKSEGEQWKSSADTLATSDPVQAFDLYTKVSTIFLGDPLGTEAAKPLRALKAQKAVSDELAARAAYLQLYNTLPLAKPEQREDAEAYCKAIVQRYPDTPTGKKADALVTDLGVGSL